MTFFFSLSHYFRRSYVQFAPTLMAEDSIILEKGKNSLQGDVKWVLTIGTPEG